ncbi:MAG: hypothetical protein KY460_09175 [Actinobacteria bacterium]|nr:hypothetical protein [Actinomycetota bacterium]
MIALGLTVEFLAVVLMVVGLLMDSSATSMLWLSIAVVLVGLGVTAIGVRRARPPRGALVPRAATTTSDGASPD